MRRLAIWVAVVFLSDAASVSANEPLVFRGSIPFEQFQPGTGFTGAFDPATGDFVTGLSPGGRTASMANDPTNPGWPRPAWRGGAAVHLDQALASANGGHHVLARDLLGKNGPIAFGDRVRAFTVWQEGSRLVINPNSGVNTAANTNINVPAGTTGRTVGAGRGLTIAEQDALIDLLRKNTPRGVNRINFVDRFGNYARTAVLMTSDGTPNRRIPLAVLPSCFAAGTLVATGEGLRPIEGLRAGDSVWAMDPVTGERALKRIVRTFANEPARIVRVTVRVSGRSEEIRTTGDHPFFVMGRGWVVAGHLERGMELATQFSDAPIVISSETTDDVVPIFNLEVEDLHTYFVGRAGLLVHNDCTPVARGALNLTPMARIGNARIPYTPSMMGLLTGVDLAFRAADEGIIPAAVGFGVGMAVGTGIALGTRMTVAALASLGLTRTASFASRAIPVVGQLILCADIAKLITNRLFGVSMSWGDVWDAYTGKLDRPTSIAAAPPPPDSNTYYD